LLNLSLRSVGRIHLSKHAGINPKALSLESFVPYRNNSGSFRNWYVIGQPPWFAKSYGTVPLCGWAAETTSDDFERTKGSYSMSALNRRDIKRLRRKRARLKKKLRCRFCPDGCDNSPRPIYVDFKDMRTLRTMINREGHILSRRRTGNCAKYQRAVRQAVLRARFIGLLAYVAED